MCKVLVKDSNKDIDFIELIKKYFKIDEVDEKKWGLKNEIWWINKFI